MKCKLGIKTTAHLLCTGTKLASKDEFAVRSCSQENKKWGKKKKKKGTRERCKRQCSFQAYIHTNTQQLNLSAREQVSYNTPAIIIRLMKEAN